MMKKMILISMMKRRYSFWGIVLFMIFCFSLLAVTLSWRNYFKNYLTESNNVNDIYGLMTDKDETMSEEIRSIIKEQRDIIKEEMEDYTYPGGKYNVEARKLSDLLMDSGGKPLRSLIVTNWRSGSTFLGDILNSHPANFYNFEPLLYLGITKVRGPPFVDEALMHLDSLLHCDYKNLGRYLNYSRTDHWVFDHNTHLWNKCQEHKDICSNPQFLEQFCRLFPFQSMKITGLRLRLTEKLLANKNLGVRIVLLIRDPRGMAQSRKNLDWCITSQDCYDPALICADMVSDYFAAVKFSKIYPETFMVIRYEDLSMNPHAYAKKIFEFYGLHLHSNVKRFLDTHTNANIGQEYSTYRNSKSTPFHWQTQMNFEEVDSIQRECKEAMRLWGYKLTVDEMHQKYFTPIINYSLLDNR